MVRRTNSILGASSTAYGIMEKAYNYACLIIQRNSAVSPGFHPGQQNLLTCGAARRSKVMPPLDLTEVMLD